jgi:5-methylcytosine-specific restriction endonuclease McrA
MRPSSIKIGDTFGRLKVISFTGEVQGKWGGRKIACICSCGNTTIVTTSNLKKGKTKSCGCLHRERVRLLGLSHRKYKEVSGFSKLYRTYICQSKRRSLAFVLSREKFAEITSSSCTYCGKKPSMLYTDSVGSLQSRYVYNSIDRVDNTKGYAEENVVPACKQCQIAKNVYSLEEFKKWVVRVHAHLSNWP